MRFESGVQLWVGLWLGFVPRKARVGLGSEQTQPNPTKPIPKRSLEGTFQTSFGDRSGSRPRLLPSKGQIYKRQRSIDFAPQTLWLFYYLPYNISHPLISIEPILCKTSLRRSIDRKMPFLSCFSFFAIALTLSASVKAGCGNGQAHHFKTDELPYQGANNHDYPYLDNLTTNKRWNIYGYYNGKSCFAGTEEPDMIVGGNDGVTNPSCSNIDLVQGAYLGSMAVWIADDMDMEVSYSPCNARTEALTAFDKLSCAKAGTGGYYCINFEDTPFGGGKMKVQSFTIFKKGFYPQ